MGPEEGARTSFHDQVRPDSPDDCGFEKESCGIGSCLSKLVHSKRDTKDMSLPIHCIETAGKEVRSDHMDVPIRWVLHWIGDLFGDRFPGRTDGAGRFFAS